MKLKLRAGLRQPRAKGVPLLLQRLLMKKIPAAAASLEDSSLDSSSSTVSAAAEVLPLPLVVSAFLSVSVSSDDFQKESSSCKK